MKRQIRQGVFETNSSSIHSITIVDKADYNEWVEGKMMFHKYEEKHFLPTEEAIAYNTKMFMESYYANGVLPKGFVEKYHECHSLSETIETFQDEMCLHADYICYEDFYLSYNEYWGCICDKYESYSSNYTTKSGDEIVAFGYYG